MIEPAVTAYIEATLTDPTVSDAEAIDLVVNLRSVFDVPERRQLMPLLSDNAQQRLKWCAKMFDEGRVVAGALLGDVAVVEVGMMFCTLANGDKVELIGLKSYRLPISQQIVNTY